MGHFETNHNGIWPKARKPFKMKESFKREHRLQRRAYMWKLPSYVFGSVLQEAEKENDFRCLKLYKSKIVKTKLQEKKNNAANAKLIYWQL